MLNEGLNLLLSQMCEQSQLVKNDIIFCTVTHTLALMPKPTRAFGGTKLGEPYDSLESGDKGYGAMMSKPEKGIRRILDPGGNWGSYFGLPKNLGLQLGVSGWRGA